MEIGTFLGKKSECVDDVVCNQATVILFFKQVPQATENRRRPVS